MATFEKIAFAEVGSGGAANIDFTVIPSTFTDLVIKASLRNTQSNSLQVRATFNSSTANFTAILLYGEGSGTPASASIARYLGAQPLANYTASTFGNMEIYIPNYAGSAFKSYSSDSVTENNATLSYAILTAGLWSSTSAITSISLTPESDSFAQYSTATLYGIKKA
jgi:hypothetical protein